MRIINNYLMFSNAIFNIRKTLSLRSKLKLQLLEEDIRQSVHVHIDILHLPYGVETCLVVVACPPACVRHEDGGYGVEEGANVPPGLRPPLAAAHYSNAHTIIVPNLFKTLNLVQKHW